MFRRMGKPSGIFVYLNQCKIHRFERKFSMALDSKVVKLTNGMSVATEKFDSPLACVSLFILAGPRFECEWNNGVSYFIEHMAYRGFKSMNKERFEKELNSVGAKIISYTSREHQCFTGICSASYTKQMISLLSKIILEPIFCQDEVIEARSKICSQLIKYDNDPKRVVFDYLHQTAFQGTPLGYSITPSSQNIKCMNSDVALSFMKENYTPRRLVLAVSGGIANHDEIAKQVESCLCDLKTGGPCFLPTGPKRYTGSEIIYRDDSMPFLHAAVAVEAPGYNSKDYLPLLLASCLTDTWEGTDGNMKNGSPLARAASTSEDFIKFKSFYIAYKDVGLWGVYFVCRMHDADDIVFNIQNGWMHLCTMLSKHDFDRAVNVAKLKLARNYNGIVNSCHNIGLQVLMTSCSKSLEDLCSELNTVTIGNLKDIGFTYIYDKCPVIAAVGPSEVFPDYVRVRSGMYWVRW